MSVHRNAAVAAPYAMRHNAPLRSPHHTVLKKVCGGYTTVNGESHNTSLSLIFTCIKWNQQGERFSAISYYRAPHISSQVIWPPFWGQKSWIWKRKYFFFWTLLFSINFFFLAPTSPTLFAWDFLSHTRNHSSFCWTNNLNSTFFLLYDRESWSICTLRISHTHTHTHRSSLWLLQILLGIYINSPETNNVRKDSI